MGSTEVKLISLENVSFDQKAIFWTNENVVFLDNPNPVCRPGDGAALEDLLGHPRLVLRLGLRQVVVTLQGACGRRRRLRRKR